MRDRRRTVARTLRETFGVGLTDLGGGVSWGEAKLLLEAAVEDTGTALGAELAGWAYPASVPTLIGIIAQVRDPKASRGLMPWVLQVSGRRPTVSDEELAAARAELEGGIVFAD